MTTGRRTEGQCHPSVGRESRGLAGSAAAVTASASGSPSPGGVNPLPPPCSGPPLYHAGDGGKAHTAPPTPTCPTGRRSTIRRPRTAAHMELWRQQV